MNDNKTSTHNHLFTKNHTDPYKQKYISHNNDQNNYSENEILQGLTKSRIKFNLKEQIHTSDKYDSFLSENKVQKLKQTFNEENLKELSDFLDHMDQETSEKSLLIKPGNNIMETETNFEASDIFTDLEAETLETTSIEGVIGSLEFMAL